MRVTVKVSQLMSQLPKEIRYALIAGGDGLPETFTFDAVEENPVLADKLERKYPAVRKVLTPIEWMFFCEMIKSDLGASITLLASLLKVSGSDYYSSSNAVAVHIRSMRNKFKAAEIPFTVENKRGCRDLPGKYKVVKKP